MSSAPIRFHEIDLLRGLACISVVAFHFLSVGPRTGAMLIPAASSFDFIARYGYLGVHLFFMISGFVILMSAQNGTARNFAASRAARLYPALWAGATITALTAWALHNGRFDVSIVQYLINLTMIAHWFDVPYVDGAYWSLSLELHFYLLVFIALKLGLLKHMEALLGAWLAVSAINAMHPIWPLEFWLAAKWAPLFVAGAVFYGMRHSGMTVVRLALLVSSFSLAQYYAIQEAARLSVRSGAQLSTPIVVGAICLFFIVFALIARGRLSIRSSPFVYYSGLLTYPVYVIHQNFGYMMFGALKPFLAWWLDLIVVIATILLLAWCVARFVERPVGIRLRSRLNTLPLPRLSVKRPA